MACNRSLEKRNALHSEIFEYHKLKGFSITDTAKHFKVCSTTVKKWVARVARGEVLEKSRKPNNRRLVNDLSPQTLKVITQDLKQDEEITINCLTKTWNDSKMWNDYANQDGLCIGLTVQRSNNGYLLTTEERFEYQHEDGNNKTCPGVEYYDVQYKDNPNYLFNRIPDET